MIDSHAHLDAPQFDDDREVVIERAAASGVTRILTVGYDRETWETATALVRRWPDRGIYLALGIHPNSAYEADDATLADLATRCTEWKRDPTAPRVVGLGETGLDYHRTHATREQQRASFQAQLALARELDLPVIIHDREAHSDIMEILRSDGGGTRGVMHSFSGDPAMAAECLRLGYMISLSGPVTFPKAIDRHDVARAVPLSGLLVETDCPYLTPVPYRGRRNEPAYVALTAARIAELRGIKLETLAAATTANTVALFGLE
ncbi:MAG: TatD family hydrolase [Chloroflexia bacterium]